MKKCGWSTESRHKRGYGSAWDKTRKRILQRDFGICQPCKLNGYIHTGNEVDHIISRAEGKRLGWAQSRIECDDNLQTICHAAHIEKTATENGKTYNPKIQIGIDGYPITK